ncbi:MAG: PAAR-like protein [Polyangiaceae bacterium]
MPKLVVLGAALQCSMGAAPSSFAISPSHKVTGDDVDAGRQYYRPSRNIASFGMCQSMSIWRCDFRTGFYSSTTCGRLKSGSGPAYSLMRRVIRSCSSGQATRPRTTQSPCIRWSLFAGR